MTPRIKRFATENKFFQFLRALFVTLLVPPPDFGRRGDEVFLPDAPATKDSSLSDVEQ